MNCIGVEQRLIDCPVSFNHDFYCGHYFDTTVQCTGKKYSVTVQSNSILHFVATVQNCTDWDIRLVGGSSPLQGRVEVCYMNQWGTICGYSNSVPTLANVICRQLGYSYYNPTVYYNSYYGMGSGGVYLYTPTLFCTGNETRLQNCYHTPLGYHQCYDQYHDIGMTCEGAMLEFECKENVSILSIAGSIDPTYTPCAIGTLQLVGGSAISEGRVEVCLGGNWSTVYGYPYFLDHTTAAVICQQVG